MPQLRQDIQVREFYYFDAIILAPERIEQAWTWQRYGQGWTMLVNDLPVAACGYVEFPGRGEFLGALRQDARPDVSRETPLSHGGAVEIKGVQLPPLANVRG